ncbi:class I SAM-dependent methyltransferase [Streptomyces sp. BH104]|uniref:class I SAM-dependent methyltransferase n=1 Tax=Streptomyces sp. BH104 TaxID=3410407 RepID=UPI003BB78A1B
MQPPAPEAPRPGDAFGRVLARCWQADAAPWSAVEVIERDDGLIRANDAARYFSALEQWPALERWAWEQAGGRILDVGCGGGRHAVEWAARGHRVVGLDSSAGAVDVTRERGVEAVVGSVPELPDWPPWASWPPPARSSSVPARTRATAGATMRPTTPATCGTDGPGANSGSGSGTRRRRRHGSTTGWRHRTNSPPSSTRPRGPWRPCDGTRTAPAT